MTALMVEAMAPTTPAKSKSSVEMYTTSTTTTLTTSVAMGSAMIQQSVATRWHRQTRTRDQRMTAPHNPTLNKRRRPIMRNHQIRGTGEATLEATREISILSPQSPERNEFCVCEGDDDEHFAGGATN